MRRDARGRIGRVTRSNIGGADGRGLRLVESRRSGRGAGRGRAMAEGDRLVRWRSAGVRRRTLGRYGARGVVHLGLFQWRFLLTTSRACSGSLCEGRPRSLLAVGSSVKGSTIVPTRRVTAQYRWVLLGLRHACIKREMLRVVCCQKQGSKGVGIAI